jgi:hypothetical protein
MKLPVEELVDLEALAEDGRPPSRSRIRAALPPGWVLDQDGRSARRDGRLLFSHSWVLLVGLVAFGAAAIGLFAVTFPRGWSGLARAALLLLVLLVIGGLVGPAVTRALNRSTRARR